MTTVTSVVGETSEQATNDLKADGFNVIVRYVQVIDPEPGRHRPVAEPGRRLAGAGAFDSDHLRRPVRHYNRPTVMTPRRLCAAVLAVGRSSEHDISLASARSVAAALDPARYDVTEIGNRPRRPLETQTATR